MKKILITVLLLLTFTGCASRNSMMDRAMAFRQRLLKASGCSFDVELTADYGDKLYTFGLSCEADTDGTVKFTVTAPQAIAGITGQISATGGKLTFDDQALAFELLAQGQLSPVSAPWILLKTLRSGYLTSCGQDGEYLRLTIDDSYEENALHLDIWLGAGDIPVRGEVLWQGRRILSMDVKNFQIR